MSKWQETKLEDLEIDGIWLNVQLESDNDGNNYTQIKIRDILKVLSKDDKYKDDE